VLPDLPRAHVSVAVRLAAAEALLLEVTRPPDALANRRRRVAGRVAAQLAVLERRDVDVDVDPIQQRAGDAGQIALDLERRARALLGRIRGVPAGAGALFGSQPENHSLSRDRRYTRSVVGRA